MNLCAANARGPTAEQARAAHQTWFSQTRQSSSLPNHLGTTTMKFLNSRLAEFNATRTQTTDGFSIKSAAGRVGGVFAFNPDPADSESIKDIPIPSWAAQHAITAWLTLDYQIDALNRNQSLSEYGRNQQLVPAKETALLAVAAAANALHAYELKIKAEEVQRYAVPQLNRGDVAGHLLDKEVRDQVRALSRDDRTKLLKTLSTGSDESLSAAILRSPIKFSDLEALALAGWTAMIDGKDPVGLADLDIKKKSIDWAKRVIAVIVGLLRQITQYTREELYEITKPQNGAALFGFSAQEIVFFEHKRAANS